MNRSYHIGQPLCDSHEFPERRDPDYDDPRALTRADLRQMLVDLPAAVLCFIGMLAFLTLLFVMVPGPV